MDIPALAPGTDSKYDIPEHIRAAVRDGYAAPVRDWLADPGRDVQYAARYLFWTLISGRPGVHNLMFIVLLLSSGVLTFTNAEHKAVLQAIGQADGSDSQIHIRRAAEAILGAPEGSLDAKKVSVKELCERVLLRSARESITKEQVVAIETAELDGANEKGRYLEARYLVRAAGLSNAFVVRELCARGADPNRVSEHNWTALHLAARARHDVEVVVALLDCGGDPNLRVAPEGVFSERVNPPTPLMCAAASTHSAETVRVLLSRGADFSATNAAGDTAEAYAREALDRPTRDAFPDDEDQDAWDEDSGWRLVGEAERVIELLVDVRSAGSWKHYTGAWRIELLLLQRLCSDGRASPLGTPHREAAWVWTQSIEELEATSGCKVTPRKNYEDASGDEWRTEKALMAHLVDLPPPLLGKVASYWRTGRDPLY